MRSDALSAARVATSPAGREPIEHDFESDMRAFHVPSPQARGDESREHREACSAVHLNRCRNGGDGTIGVLTP